MFFKKKVYDSKLFKNLPDKKLLFSNDLPIIIFGAGTVAKYVTKSLLKLKIPILAYTDNNVKLQGVFLNGYKIITPQELKKKYSKFPVVIASVIY